MEIDLRNSSGFLGIRQGHSEMGGWQLKAKEF
ncbi:hypothetical protein swp_0301 [Shewanella piezotolerans WP3]|uniref:Uncharacterized protein n=1 Tax=Shewanella piezotolerans (strain WP3 / JCM 13877) TaxID=225849 RepID=B8CHL3_SHEPW|nr:hypothetical protein swp_0301 [Shewanella piezotolerans WP3]